MLFIVFIIFKTNRMILKIVIISCMCSPPNVRVWANRPYGLTSLAQSLSVTHLRKNCSINLIDFCLLFQFFDIIKMAITFPDLCQFMSNFHITKSVDFWGKLAIIKGNEGFSN